MFYLFNFADLSGVCFGPFCYLFLLHSTFSADITFNEKLSQNKFCYSHAALDAPCLYKITEGKNLSLV